MNNAKYCEWLKKQDRKAKGVFNPVVGNEECKRNSPFTYYLAHKEGQGGDAIWQAFNTTE